MRVESIFIHALLIAVCFSSGCGRGSDNARTPDLTDSTLDPSLLEASRKGRTDTVRNLLKKGANVNAKHKELPCTPLMWAAQGGHTDTAIVLLEAGADTTLDVEGYTALMFAAQEGHVRIVQALLDKGADPNTRDKQFGLLALTLAAQGGHADVVRALLDKGADVNGKDGFARTALMMAAEAGANEVVRLLLAHGADANATDIKGKTALSWAEDKGHSGITRLFAQKSRAQTTSQISKAVRWLEANNRHGPSAPIVAQFTDELNKSIAQEWNRVYWHLGSTLTKSRKPYILSWVDGTFHSVEMRTEDERAAGYRANFFVWSQPKETQKSKAQTTSRVSKAVRWLEANNRHGPTAQIVAQFTDELNESIAKGWNQVYWHLGSAMTKSRKPYILCWVDGTFRSVEMSTEEERAAGYRADSFTWSKGIREQPDAIVISNVRINGDALQNDKPVSGSLDLDMVREVDARVALSLSYFISWKRIETYFYPESISRRKQTISFEFPPVNVLTSSAGEEIPQKVVGTLILRIKAVTGTRLDVNTMRFVERERVQSNEIRVNVEIH